MWGAQRSQLLRVIILVLSVLTLGRGKPREMLHRVQVAPFIKSLCPCEYGLLESSESSSLWQGYLTHSCQPLIFPGLYQLNMPFSALCHRCSRCWLSGIILLGLSCPCDTRTTDAESSWQEQGEYSNTLAPGVATQLDTRCSRDIPLPVALRQGERGLGCNLPW
jgi:hypothetical protein